MQAYFIKALRIYVPTIKFSQSLICYVERKHKIYNCFSYSLTPKGHLKFDSVSKTAAHFYDENKIKLYHFSYSILLWY